ncbi:YbaY family lipoprotein [Salinicola sp. DM10]|uniref:YbaY family lipoprotein n=1 Tax=Salinicola sp. DM10 TaxID=2815721 RepID=UPI001A8D923F|nr:YbaY family lipoprotein [Salinicola sp. DM10]MCE3027068.1 YbaY family lipoprotein [Salinicola sp. DM10]
MPLPALSRGVRSAAVLLAVALLAGCAGGPQFETLAARVVSENPVTLPADATLEVQLEDVTHGDVVASSRYEQLGQLPLPVTLQYLPDAIARDDIYQLSAQIRSHGRIIYLSQKPVAVFGRQDPAEPDIPVVPTGADALAPSAP